ncbi:MAG: DNA alkylation repair protein [Muribaculaceae bacterium]|nr:DNA alkylation repair protein [Muribaculaceae bacterium]
MSEIWKSEIDQAGSPEKAKILSRFFKTGKGEYGEGDIFVGVTVPVNREIAKKYFEADFSTLKSMLDSPIHEHRLSGLLALVQKYKKKKGDRDAIVKFYLTLTDRINNWDLVDLSAPYILGDYLNENYDQSIIEKISNSSSIWERRIAIVATLAMIRKNNINLALELSRKYLTDTHPLIHKATGWILREVGKKDEKALLDFLDKHTPMMPRTTLRYAIERLDKETRTHYINITRKNQQK